MEDYWFAFACVQWFAFVGVCGGFRASCGGAFAPGCLRRVRVWVVRLGGCVWWCGRAVSPDVLATPAQHLDTTPAPPRCRTEMAVLCGNTASTVSFGASPKGTCPRAPSPLAGWGSAGASDGDEHPTNTIVRSAATPARADPRFAELPHLKRVRVSNHEPPTSNASDMRTAATPANSPG